MIHLRQGCGGLARVLAIVLGITLCAITAAFAVTREEVAACYPDAVRLCGVPRNVTDAGAEEKLKVGLCMLFHLSDLSPRCRAVFSRHGF